MEGGGEAKLKELDRGLEDVQRRLRKVEGKKGKLGDEEGGGDWMEVSRRLKELEWGMEKREREERKRNIMVRGLRTEGKEARREVEELCKKLETRVHIEKIRKIKGGAEESELMVVRLGSEEEKREIMGKKRLLKGSEVWVEEDLTWKERRLRWCLRKIAGEE
ncbi:hypothetical protein RF55_20333 [Lasius niger]|uniref:Uncharacterized protein n=1 Tax=Lasius niger TaxID=67767 RepID=A0A0J7JZJ9_LASNI|nr:hypothetical protein RF55_20333 [Lasius niger]